MNQIQIALSRIITSSVILWTLLILTGTVSTPGIQADDDLMTIVSPDYPSLSALMTTLTPPSDRLDLARRFWHITDLPAPPESPPDLKIGDRATFRVNNAQTHEEHTIEATLRAISEHVLVYVESGYVLQPLEAEQFAQGFDTRVYEPVRVLWGTEPVPGIDGDSRLVALFTTKTSPGTAAYFASRHLYPVQVASGSNQREMLIFNLRAFRPLNTDYALAVAAHEFQHMIRYRLNQTTPSLLDEGFSMFTERLISPDLDSWAIEAFMESPQTSLNGWRESGNVRPRYGAGLLLMTYLDTCYGRSVLQQVSQMSGPGLSGVDKALRQAGYDTGLDGMFLDKVLANTSLTPPAICDYPASLTLPPVHTIRIPSLPAELTLEIPQYATRYLDLTELTGETVQLAITAPDTVPLLPVSPVEGRFALYAPPANHSNPRLTRQFDLTQLNTATLTWRTWYDLEDDWDYAYVSISTDSGQTWTPLPAPGTTTDNPNSRSYGHGYTGESDGWRTVSHALDRYAGQVIQIRFEVVTDDATLEPGMMLDNIAIPELDYQTGFETPEQLAGWQIEGWAQVDNRLPQTVWLQIVQQQADGTIIHERWQADNTPRQHTLADSARRVLLAMSPIAPFTEMPATIHLSLTAPESSDDVGEQER